MKEATFTSQVEKEDPANLSEVSESKQDQEVAILQINQEMTVLYKRGRDFRICEGKRKLK